MEAILTLHQAGNRLGVEDTTLSRLIRVGGLPEARKVNRPEGLVWVIPHEDLPAIARRNGWTIDLRDGAEELLIDESAGQPSADAVTESAPDGLTEAAVDGVTKSAVDGVTESAPDSLTESAPHPDLEGWDTSLWNQAVGIGLDTAEIDISDLVPGSGATLYEESTPVDPVAIPTPEDAADHPSGLELEPEPETAPEPEPEDFSLAPVADADRASAIEVSIASAPVPADDDDDMPVPAGRSEAAVQSMVEALDLALLERLLEAQEGRVSAEVLAQEKKHALSALNVTHNRTTAELDVERRERMIAADRYREERMARAVADAKVAELRDRLLREMALADTEKAARTEALTRSVKAERDAANALAAMGWRARRRYRKLSAAMSEQVVVENVESAPQPQPDYLPED
ncbi:MAG: hypothetical protein AAF531_17570 [Actinomycetota bacterium]